MFVLCPHCHFLVGIDPRTGKPPAGCPKCGGVVVEPLPETHAEEILVPAPLAPFAPVELPSVLPTLPEPESESVSAAVEPTTPAPVAAPAIASTAPIETPAPPRTGWWSRRSAGPSTAPSSAAPVEPPAASAAAAAKPPAPTGAQAAPAEPVDPRRADAMIAAIQGRRRTSRKIAAPPPPGIEPASVVTAVETDTALARIEEAATTSTAIDMPVETPRAAPVKRPRHAPAPANATDATAATAEAVAAVATAIPPVVEAAPAVDIPPVGIVSADAVVPPHPLRRRTDFDPNASAEPGAGVPPTHPLRRRTDAPSFTRPRVRASAASRIGWRSLVTVGGLCLLLALQLLLAQRDTLAASPRWRSTIAAVCMTLRCSLPSWHEPSAFTMLSRDVRPHPNAPGTLLINASFRNDARWPQRWPHLVLTLSDLDGRMVGARSFAAGEYLGSMPTQSELAPGQTAAVAMSVVEPAPNIVAFTFDFR